MDKEKRHAIAVRANQLWEMQKLFDSIKAEPLNWKAPEGYDYESGRISVLRDRAAGRGNLRKQRPV